MAGPVQHLPGHRRTGRWSAHRAVRTLASPTPVFGPSPCRKGALTTAHSSAPKFRFASGTAWIRCRTRAARVSAPEREPILRARSRSGGLRNPSGPLCVTETMADVETHGYPLGSAAASIVGIADGLLEREDLDEDLVTRLRAIRDLALELAREAGRGEPNPAVPTLLEKVRRDGSRETSSLARDERAEQPPTSSTGPMSSHRISAAFEPACKHRARAAPTALSPRESCRQPGERLGLH